MKKCIVGLTRQTTGICCCGQLPIIINRKKNPQNEKHLNWSEHENNLLKFLSHVCEQLHYPKKVVNLDDASKMLNLCNTLHTLSSFDKASYIGMISLMNEFLKKGEYIIIVCINR